MRHAARTDANQAPIFDALRKIGVQVEYIKLPMDALIYIPRRNETALLEVKVDGGRFTKEQVEFISRWGGKIYVVRSPEDAVRQVLGEEVMR